MEFLLDFSGSIYVLAQSDRICPNSMVTEIMLDYLEVIVDSLMGEIAS